MKIKRKLVLGALYLMSALSLTSCKEKEKQIEATITEEQEVEEVEKIKSFVLGSCDVIIENFPDGSVKHHFITTKDYEMFTCDFQQNDEYKECEYEYKAITEDDLMFTDSVIYYTDINESYEKIPETKGNYIFDYNLPYFKMKAKYINLPEGYSLNKEYSIDEFKELEKKLDLSLYKGKKENKKYNISTLLLAEVAGEYMCFDMSTALNSCNHIIETEFPEDVTKLREVIYVPSVGNDFINIKIRLEEELNEENKPHFYILGKTYVFEDITLLDQTIRNDLRENQLIFKNFSDYIDYETKVEGTISSSKIRELLVKLNSPEYKLKEKLISITEELTEQNGNVKVYFTDTNLIISEKEHATGEELPNAFYEKLNALIEEGNFNWISLENIDDTLDLGKIDFTKISRKTLRFKNYEGFLDCSSLTGDLEIYFTNTKGHVASEILSSCDTKSSFVYWGEDVEKNSELQSFLEGIVENNKKLYLLRIDEKNKENYKGISNKEFELISQVKVEHIGIDADGFRKPIHLDIELNPIIKSLSIDAYEICDRNNNIIKNAELGNINIKSENQNFCCYFYNTDITKNTSFSLPNATYLSLYNLNCTDIGAFKALNNISHLNFKEDLHADGEADLRGAMVYDANKTPEAYFGEIPYTDYDTFLKELEYFFKLKQLKEKLHISSLYSYYTPKYIGSYITLDSDEVMIYQSLEDLCNKQNAIFGTKEDGCIRSICLTNNEDLVNVDNTEDYYYYLNNGYEVIGYTFVNLNSTPSEDYEFFVEDDQVRLLLTPFE